MVDAEISPPPPKFCTYQHGVEPIEPEEGETRVYRVALDACEAGDAFAEAPEWAWLTAEERARAERLVRPRDGRRFVLCRGALRAIIGRLLDRSPHAVEFRAGPGGKPILPPGEPGSPPPLHFNVSHSGELALIAVSRSRELGVDVEKTRPISEAARIVRSYFTETETEQFHQLEEAARPDAFIRGWTRKEAILKAKGVGLAGLATGFETMFGVEDLGREFVPCAPSSVVLGWSLWEASPRPGYVAALALERG
ncbi:MAG: 4'-phosphopantetheinyl transferase superfamily protein [Paludisphaera borealis]|uniref:4'-phosphopantetheinyl transferase family protein n=1 Tax=Paludisphaera borealis TaxID=1387353 RepID=UPI002849045D|nr:4'-phosphopantetheinyl transferase superfamily protein [Paludisphaera borealis]MDR3621292.1 4'-phosphopantetheinyl transferase superfamily protein [Paludisphaera borealis]